MKNNKKIQNASHIVDDNIEFKSKLEKKLYSILKEKGFDVKYEPVKYTVWEGFKPTVPFFNRKGTDLKPINTKIQDITYTPDFVFEYKGVTVIMEIKGFENDVFPYKKKLFRKYLETWDKPVMYFEIRTQRELLKSLEYIEEYVKKIT